MTPRLFAVLGALLLAVTTVVAQDSRPTKASDPYTLDTCALSGKKLGSMGDPVVEVISGREVRFCCSGCVPTFKKDAAKHFAKLDAKLAADQRRYYPLSRCLVSKEKIAEDKAQEVFVGNRLVRTCCSGCEKKLKAKPAKYLARLDAVARKLQGRAYPLETCLVSGGKLGGMGKPVEVILGGRLVKLCCKGCLPKLHKSPATYLAKLDAAWAKRGFPGVVKNSGEGAPRQGEGKGKKPHDHGAHKN